MAIRNINIAARGQGEDFYTEPPSQVLDLSVIGEDAHLSVVELDEKGARVTSDRDVVVPARSLLFALRAAIEDTDSGN